VCSMRIALGSDHAGYDLKTLLKSTLVAWGYDVLDLGTNSASEPVDYPDFWCRGWTSGGVRRSRVGRGVLCSGIGVAMAANKVPGVRAAVVHDVTSGHSRASTITRNVLCMGGRLLGSVVAIESMEAWLNATPKCATKDVSKSCDSSTLQLANEEK